MGRYRKIDTRIWNDAKFRALSDDGKLVFLFVLTHPHLTSLGAMRATIKGLAHELGWNEKRFREGFGEGFRKALFQYDEKACFVALPNFLRYNGPESPNVVKSWSESLDLLPECSLKAELLQRVKGFTEGLSEAFAKALPEAFAKGMPNQEPEQEQEQNTSFAALKTERVNKKSFPDGFDQFWEAYPNRNGRKVGKQAAVELFEKLTVEDRELVIQAAKNYAADQRCIDGYSKDPERFLKKEFWRDFIGTPVSRVMTDEELAAWRP